MAKDTQYSAKIIFTAGPGRVLSGARIAMQHVITIHGYGFDRRIWSPVELAFEGYNVIHLELPGFGEASPLGEYSIAGLAEQYWQALGRAGFSDGHLLGHSMGGYVAIAMAALRPHALRSLSLVHSHVFADSEEKKRARQSSADAIRTSGREVIVEKLIPSVFGDATLHKETIRLLMKRASRVDEAAWVAGLLAMRDRADHQSTLAALDCPVHIISGLRDTAVAPETAYAQAAMAARTKLTVYPQAGHMSMYEAGPELIRDISGFLSYADGYRP
jgi:pimeloyl-ACP methyl ester carboxylesterase